MTATSIALLVAGILLVVLGVLLLVVRKLRPADSGQVHVFGVEVAGPVGLVVIAIGVFCMVSSAFVKPTGAANVTAPPANPTVSRSSSPTSSSSASPSPTAIPDAYIGHIVERVNVGGQPNTSWLVGRNGERYWIPTTSIFHCLVREGHTTLGRQSSTVLDDLPDLGQRASCA